MAGIRLGPDGPAPRPRPPDCGGAAAVVVAGEAARQQTLDQINIQLADTGDYQRIEALLSMREQAWDEEEAQRGNAQHIFYDCISAAKRPG